MNSVPTWNMTYVLAVLIGIVAFSMFMGNRSARNKARTSWWGGLVVVLIIVSGVMSFTFLKRGVREERFSDRQLWTKNIKGQVEEHVRNATEKAKDTVDQAMRSLNIAEEKGKTRTVDSSGNGFTVVSTS